jgi:hypothetical protein
MCDPLEGIPEPEFNHVPCITTPGGFTLIGAYYEDEEKGYKWIWYIAGVEDYLNRPEPEADNRCWGAYEARAFCLSGSDIDVGLPPTEISVNSNMTNLCQEIFDRSSIDGKYYVHRFAYSVLEPDND